MPTLPVIRAAAKTDAIPLASLIARTIRTSNAADYDATIIDAICANFTVAKVLEKMAVRDVLVAEAGDLLCGTVSFGGGKLHSLFVDPPRQGVGLGRQLTLHIENHARGKGMTELHLSSSLTARSFYEKLGYRLLQFEPRPDGSTWLMVKTLA